MKANRTVFLLAAFCLSLGAMASELDDVSKAPALVLSKLNADTGTITKYKVEADASISPQTLKDLSETERKARIEAFVARQAVPANQISEEKAVKVTSELDSTGSTASCWGRWRGYRGGWYGGGYYNYGCYYRPVWNYGCYGGGYVSHYSAGYYGGGYYGGGNYYTLYNGGGGYGGYDNNPYTGW